MAPATPGGAGPEDLGVYSPAELRACGINEIGFLQPVLPAPGDADVASETADAARSLVERGLLVNAGDPARWRPAGLLGKALEAFGSARSMVCCETPEPPGLVLALSKLGSTDRVLLMRRDGRDFFQISLDSQAKVAAAMQAMTAPGTRIEAASIDAPGEPLLQQRIHFLADDRMVIGARRGADSWTDVVAHDRGPVEDVVARMLAGAPLLS